MMNAGGSALTQSVPNPCAYGTQPQFLLCAPRYLPPQASQPAPATFPVPTCSSNQFCHIGWFVRLS